MALTRLIFSAYILVLSLFASLSDAYYPIKGATGGLYPRLEIRQMFRTEPDQWNLYLLALRHFQAIDQTKQTSWYQIHGIHGAPMIPWDGVKGDGGEVGYCTHGNNLFGPWHRPYIALFEQKLQEAAYAVANSWPNGGTRDKYLHHARTLRSPFWDWAAAPPNGNPNLPLIVSQKYVTVKTSSGSKTIINPLYRYTFHPVKSNQVAPYGGPWNYWSGTLRYPTSASAQGAGAQDNLAQATLDHNRVSQRQSVYNWFTLCPHFAQIAQDGAPNSSPDCHISLEALHNNIHVWVGGPNNGHMTVVPVSAWDPTFMLHHTMIDRLFAMWQTLYPHSYITNEVSATASYTIHKGAVLGPDTHLHPFHRNVHGDFWTPTSVRDWRKFGYTYPEHAHSDGSASAIRGYVNRLYGPNARYHAGSSKDKRDPGLLELIPGVPNLPLTVTHASNGSSYQYIANIQTTRYQLDGSYLVYLFFGEPASDDSSKWGTDANMVGSYGVFSMPGMTSTNTTTTSTVPLTDALTDSVANGLLQTLEETFVVPFLEKSLTWRILKSDGTVVDPADVPDLLISVVSSTMQSSSDPNAFPTWSKFNLLSQITKNKQGGLKSAKDLVLLGTNLVNKGITGLLSDLI